MRWNVGMKLVAGFGTALAMLALIGWVAHQSIGTLTDTSRWVDHTDQVKNKILVISKSLVEAESAQRGYLISGDNSYLATYQTAIDEAKNGLSDFKKLTGDNPRQQDRAAQLARFLQRRIDLLGDGIQSRKEGGVNAANAWLAGPLPQQTMSQILSLLGSMQNEEDKLLAVRKADADSSATTARATIRWGTVVALLCVMIVSLALTRNIALPLRSISEKAELISQGDLEVSVPVRKRQDEVGDLLRTFSGMTASLRTMAQQAGRIADGDLAVEVHPQSDRDVLGNAFASMVSRLRKLTADIGAGVEVLGAAASEISTSTAQLSANAVRTASAISETTTTVEEVRQTVHDSSNKAKMVSDSAQRTAVTSQEGQEATRMNLEGMTRIRRQMDAIADSMVRLSEQGAAIGQIVSTVEGLAAQSNLLAVNASIEAAKAGDQGRGFAVVAQEVKALADQSRQATTRVRAILADIQKATQSAVLATEQGTRSVDQGLVQSTQAGESIEELAGKVSEAAQTAAQIAASSRQQLAGVEQVAAAMESIKQASVQNAASARQMESAAQNLGELGHRLKQIVDQYRI